MRKESDILILLNLNYLIELRNFKVESVKLHTLKVLLNLLKMEIEGSMSAESVNCQNAVIRVYAEYGIGASPSVQEICGTDETLIQPITSKNNTVRIR